MNIFLKSSKLYCKWSLFRLSYHGNTLEAREGDLWQVLVLFREHRKCLNRTGNKTVVPFTITDVEKTTTFGELFDKVHQGHTGMLHLWDFSQYTLPFSRRWKSGVISVRNRSYRIAPCQEKHTGWKIYFFVEKSRFRNCKNQGNPLKSNMLTFGGGALQIWDRISLHTLHPTARATRPPRWWRYKW